MNQALELRKQREREGHSKGREHLDKDLETSRQGCARDSGEVAAGLMGGAVTSVPLGIPKGSEKLTS